jgi:hypothetical protein
MQSCPQVIQDVFYYHAEEACDISYCESRWEWWAYNRSSGATGYFQVLPYWHQSKADYLYSIGYLDNNDLMDPVTNTIVAAVISGWGVDWDAWVC